MLERSFDYDVVYLGTSYPKKEGQQFQPAAFMSQGHNISLKTWKVRDL